jgi:hypothetical protein
MGQRAGRARFLFEASEPARVGREARRQDLDRDLAIEPRITCPIDAAHATGADQPANFIRSDRATGRRLRIVGGHRHVGNVDRTSGVVRRKHGTDFGTHFRIQGGRAVDESQALSGRTIERRLEQLRNLPPSLWSHGLEGRPYYQANGQRAALEAARLRLRKLDDHRDVVRLAAAARA